MTVLGEAALIIGAIAAVAGAGISIASAVTSANKEAELSEVVAEQKEVEAVAIRESAKADEVQARRRAAFLIGKQRAITAASGLDPGYGSAIDLEIDTVQQAELEALSIRRVGALSSSAREYEANISRFRGESARDTIPYAIAGGVLQAGSSLASAYGAYSSNKKTDTILSSWKNR